MAIKKSLRKGTRYILFEQHYEKTPKNENEIINNIKKYIGLLEIPPLKIIYFDNKYGLIKTNENGLKKVIASLILSSDEGNRIETLDSSGTIKSIIERNSQLKEKIKKN